MNERNQKNCESCQYFVKHYIRYDDGRYIPIMDGHCTEPRLKRRTEDTPACVHWKKRKKQDAKDKNEDK